MSLRIFFNITEFPTLKRFQHFRYCYKCFVLLNSLYLLSIYVTESEATFNVEETTRFEPGMSITTVNLESNKRIRDMIFLHSTHCKHKHASCLINVCNRFPCSVNAEISLQICDSTDSTERSNHLCCTRAWECKNY
jgi:hypothetical protein